MGNNLPIEGGIEFLLPWREQIQLIATDLTGFGDCLRDQQLANAAVALVAAHVETGEPGGQMVPARQVFFNQTHGANRFTVCDGHERGWNPQGIIVPGQLFFGCLYRPSWIKSLPLGEMPTGEDPDP